MTPPYSSTIEQHDKLKLDPGMVANHPGVVFSILHRLGGLELQLELVRN